MHKHAIVWASGCEGKSNDFSEFWPILFGPFCVWPALLRYRLFQQRDQFIDAPDVIANPGFHRGGHAQRGVNPAKVVISEVQRNHVTMVLYLLRERIRQPRKPSHAHPHREILAFHIRLNHPAFVCIVQGLGPAVPCRIA